MTVLDQIGAPACGCDDAGLGATLMSVSDALAAGLALVKPVDEVETVPLHQAKGRILAETLTAKADMPAFDNSGMDGYAFCLADMDAAAGVPIVGVSAAGDRKGTLTPGTAMRIYTGAPLPDGADTVVMQEHTRPRGARLHLTRTPPLGANIRRQAEDQKRHDAVLWAGCRLDARSIAMAAGAGFGTLTVRRKLRIGLLLTGDEITTAGDDLTPGAIWDVNSPMLSALISTEYTDITLQKHVPDSRPDLRSTLARMAHQVDMIVTSGGISVGDRDHVKWALETLGASIAVSGVAIKPGKPVTLSSLGRTVIVSLPGNPVSAFVTWVVLARAITDRLAGLLQASHVPHIVRANAPLWHKPGRCEYRPAVLVGHDPIGIQNVDCGGSVRSAQLAPLAGADGLVRIPGDEDHIAKGDLLEFLPL